MNWWMRVLQTLALPLGHVTIFGATVAAPFGAADEARTRYLHLGKVALYQMSYGRIFGAFILAPSRAILSNFGVPAKACEARFCGEEEKVWRSSQQSCLQDCTMNSRTFDEATRIGLEPTTPSVTGWCSNQLSYRAISGAIITTPLWSGRRGSNSLPPPWQGGALPDELRPHIRGTGVILVLLKGGASDRNRTNDTGIFSPLLYRLSYRGAPDDDYYT